MPHLYFIMGVSGTGKSTIGKALSKALGIPFFDGDDFHPKANIQKMANGHPLNDADRKPWLERLALLAKVETKRKGAVIACSALKAAYRAILSKDLNPQPYWIFLDGPAELILQRLKKRPGHFMPPDLLQSQLDTLEKPDNALTISILADPNTIVETIVKHTTMNELSEFGLIGLGVMGKSLSLNLAEKGFSLSLYNRHETGVEEKVAEHFVAENSLLKKAKAFDDIPAFVASLSQPRRILLMIKAGDALDEMIETMIPLLSEGDVLIDGGNSHYQDTKRRIDYLKTKQLHFIGAGISGGEEGARRGPSIMPGGPKAAYDLVSPYLTAIAAKAKSDRVCCSYIGEDGSGHFVKMVHNGIEYAEMQLIAESYGLLRYGAGYNPDEIAAMFESWMKMGLGSYLLEITTHILKTKENEEWLIDKILDQAGNKGTGSWTTIAAAELGVPATMITAALFARYTSAFKKERMLNARIYNLQDTKPEITIDHAVLKTGYKVARLINHHQGFQLIEAASEQYHWNLNLSEIARVWTNGCIIRSELMGDLVKILAIDKQLLNYPAVVAEVTQSMGALAKIQQWSSVSQHPVPCFAAAQHYLFAWTDAQSTANLIQAQRDFFGAHRYQRTDDESGKSHHTNWPAL